MRHAINKWPDIPGIVSSRFFNLDNVGSDIGKEPAAVVMPTYLASYSQKNKVIHIALTDGGLWTILYQRKEQQ